ncbi:MAG: four-carbon acid sugar kinase family protein [Anaerolineae bacterium]
MPIQRDALFAQLPPEWPVSLLPLIQSHVRKGAKVIVLDDDPTGTQTVHDVPVLTHWSIAALVDELARPEAVAYILTNSRAVSAAEARAMNLEIAGALRAASEITGREIAVVSRSDSTLRGHYAVETQALIEALGTPVDGVLVIPFFLEGGRYTVEDVHYVDEGGLLVPAAETESARDPVFGYASSDLRRWVAEKVGDGLTSDQVASISLADLRVGGPRLVEMRLSQLSDAQPCVVNAVSYRDLEVLVAAVLASEAQRRRYLYRTASSFVRVRGGLDPAPLLTATDFDQRSGGLVVAGSFVGRTTAQIEAAALLPHVVSLELDAAGLLGDGAERAVSQVRAAAVVAMEAGHDALVYTSRQLITADTVDNSLNAGQRISAALVRLVSGLERRPAWIIGKGGITSSDLATGALGIRRAWVRGQAIPGVPVWRTGPESRWPDLDYVVFPGNVGGPGALAEMISLLRGAS